MQPKATEVPSTALRRALDPLTLADGASRIALLDELFRAGAAVPRAGLEEAIAPTTLGELERAGLITIGPDAVAPAARAAVFDGLLLFGDSARVIAGGDPEAVTGLSTSSMLTASLTVRRRAQSALDLGCGSGAQALLAARHSDRVTAIDLNERALRFARLNADLNGARSIRFLQGSWFEPLDAGERFDLIVANLPFVPAPKVRSLYRDSPLPAAELVQGIVKQCLDRLTDGGLAHLMIAWTRTDSESALAFPTELLSGRACDSVLIRHGGVPARQYAEGLAGAVPTDATLVGSYIEHYERHGIEVIETAHLVLRRRDAERNWRRMARLFRRPVGQCGEQLDRIIRAQDWLEQASDDDVLQRAFAVAPHEIICNEDGVAMMRGVPDIGFSGSLPGDSQLLVAKLDPSIRLIDLLGSPPADSIEVVRNLVGLGFVIPVPSSTRSRISSPPVDKTEDVKLDGP